MCPNERGFQVKHRWGLGTVWGGGSVHGTFGSHVACNGGEKGGETSRQSAREAKKAGWGHGVQSKTGDRVASSRYLEIVVKTFHLAEVERELRTAENGAG